MNKESEPGLIVLKPIQETQDGYNMGNFDTKQNDIINAEQDLKIKIEVDSLEITFKHCDDFGAIFRPYIQINVPENDPVVIQIYQGGNEDKLNVSDVSNNDSHNISQTLNLSGNGSILGGFGEYGEKYYNFKEVNK